MAKIFRLFIAALIVLFPVLLGWYHRSPALIPIIGIIYVPLYFLGKAGAWALFENAPGRAQLLKAVPITFIIQCVLVGIFYLMGVGLGTLFADRSIHWLVGITDLIWVLAFLLLTLPLTFLIAVLENPNRRAEQSHDPSKNINSDMEDGDEFYPLQRVITPETFYRGEHFSRRNYTGTALTDIVDYKGEKPVRAPKRASEAMITEVEKQLGFAFPETLRTLYKIQNGGSLPTYYVPKHDGAKNIYEDWITAFATDYDDLKPLESLQTLHSLYMEGYDPNYDNADVKDGWIRESEKLIVLTIRTGYGTALDYRPGDTPGVLLFDMNKKELELKRFDDFDSFLNACREIQYDYERDDGPIDVAFGTPPNPIDADRFWESGNAGPGVAKSDWESASQRLGAPLPDEFFPFFAAANGGKAKYKVALRDDGGDKRDPLHVFPTGPYVHAGNFLKLEHWVSLATLSDRLNFIDGYTPWRDLYDAPERLIIISAAFDSAVMLDYRESAEAPSVMAIPDLDTPDSAHIFPSVTNFLSRLHKYGRPEIEARHEIGDDKISARLSNSESFWIEDPARAAVSPETLKAFLAKWDLTTFGLPAAVTQLYERQNGGQIRFRFAPPQTRNAHGYTQRLLSSESWVDVFPNGWRALEDWQEFSEWREAHKLAVTQSLFDFTDRIQAESEADENITLRLFVIGAETSNDEPTLTLLDMSEDYFNRNRHILTVRYDVQDDRFEIIFGPIMSDNIYAGLHQSLRALKNEL